VVGGGGLSCSLAGCPVSAALCIQLPRYIFCSCGLVAGWQIADRPGLFGQDFVASDHHQTAEV
jgi:hypothetical protein